MPSWPAIWGWSSIFILTSATLPPESATAFSSAGASCLHGPHHGAQKSTSTGWRVEAVRTSARNDAVVTSLTGVGAPAPSLLAIFASLQKGPRGAQPHLNGVAARIIQRIPR